MGDAGILKTICQRETAATCADNEDGKLVVLACRGMNAVHDGDDVDVFVLRICVEDGASICVNTSQARGDGTRSRKWSWYQSQYWPYQASLPHLKLN